MKICGTCGKQEGCKISGYAEDFCQGGWIAKGEAPPDLLTVAKGALGYLEALPPHYRPDPLWMKPLKAAISDAERRNGNGTGTPDGTGTPG
jgi:hypothetical protein